MMKIKDITNYLEEIAPPSFQESYDNAGLIYGDSNKTIDKALVCLDLTEDVLNEAVSAGADLIISHHPIVFKGIKKLTGKNYVEKILIKAIQKDIAIYAIHTNLDNVINGVNERISQNLNLKNIQVLRQVKGQLKKLVVYCPDIKMSDGQYVPGMVRNAIFEAGAGFIGDYDSCSFNSDGLGTYRGLEGTNPFIGTQGNTNVQKEVKIETIFPSHLEQKIISKMIEVHPYEEVAYDVYPLENSNTKLGAGIFGELAFEMDEKEFLKFVKEKMKVKVIRHTRFLNKTISKIAVCGGSGSFLLPDAINKNADVFISADFKYHDFFDADGKILIADIGHFESEQFTIDLIHDLLIKKFPTFAVSKTKVITNPINYL